MNKQLDQLIEACESRGITCIKEMLNPCGMRTSICRRERFLGALSIKDKKGRWYTVDVTPWCEVSTGKDFTVVDYQNQYTVPETILFYFTDQDNDSGQSYFQELRTKLLDGAMEGMTYQTGIECAVQDSYVYAGRSYKERNIITGTDDITFEAKNGNILPVDFSRSTTPQNDVSVKWEGKVYFAYIPALVYLHAEGRRLKRLLVNGKEVNSLKEKASGVREDLKYNVTDTMWTSAAFNVTHFLDVGVNILEIEYAASDAKEVECTDVTPEYSPLAYFRGNFRVDDRNRTVAPRDFITYGSWENQGFPYFAGEGIYKTRISVHGMDNDSVCRAWKKAVLRFQTDCAASVYINGRYVADSKEMSHEIDVTDVVHDNVNEVTLVLSAICGSRQQTVSTRDDMVQIAKERGEKSKANGLAAPIQIVLYN